MHITKKHKHTHTDTDTYIQKNKKKISTFTQKEHQYTLEYYGKSRLLNLKKKYINIILSSRISKK